MFQTMFLNYDFYLINPVSLFLSDDSVYLIASIFSLLFIATVPCLIRYFFRR